MGLDLLSRGTNSIGVLYLNGTSKIAKHFNNSKNSSLKDIITPNLKLFCCFIRNGEIEGEFGEAY